MKGSSVAVRVLDIWRPWQLQKDGAVLVAHWRGSSQCYGFRLGAGKHCLDVTSRRRTLRSFARGSKTAITQLEALLISLRSARLFKVVTR
eukprot:55017-Amphidinium_carterae.2